MVCDTIMDTWDKFFKNFFQKTVELPDCDVEEQEFGKETAELLLLFCISIAISVWYFLKKRWRADDEVIEPISNFQSGIYAGLADYHDFPEAYWEDMQVTDGRDKSPRNRMQFE